MQRTRRLSALALVASLSLLLASCGGSGMPAPDTSAGEATTAPVPGGTIPVPADATAASEFVVTGVRAQQLAQALGLIAADVQANAGTGRFRRAALAGAVD